MTSGYRLIGENDPYSQQDRDSSTSPVSNVQPSENQSNIEEIFKCFICFGKVQNAVMCPYCSKLCCGGCMKVILLH